MAAQQGQHNNGGTNQELAVGRRGHNFSSSMGQLSQVLKISVGILQLTKKGKDSSE